VHTLTTNRVDLSTLDRVGRALANPTRRQILLALLDEPGYPAQLAERLHTSRANLSNHLTCLRECGLVTATSEGRHVRYTHADPQLGDALRILVRLRLDGTCTN
jgi:DNA-binding transcriptional ArsR family regulator